MLSTMPGATPESWDKIFEGKRRQCGWSFNMKIPPSCGEAATPAAPSTLIPAQSVLFTFFVSFCGF